MIPCGLVNIYIATYIAPLRLDETGIYGAFSSDWFQLRNASPLENTSLYLLNIAIRAWSPMANVQSSYFINRSLFMMTQLVHDLKINFLGTLPSKVLAEDQMVKLQTLRLNSVW